MNAILEVEKDVGTHCACDALGISKSSYYRAMAPMEPENHTPPREHKQHPRAYSEEEEQIILETLDSEEYRDMSPAEVYGSLLDKGTYLCSISKMYSVLRKHQQVRERRDQLRHPNYKKPELRATGPNQVWTWDISKLRGPIKWVFYYLYVIIDIYSRYVVGWMIACKESNELAQTLIEETCKKQQIEPGHLIIHADRGPSMTSKPVGLLLEDLGVAKTHSRPHVSNDNPFSESGFKTLKYRPEFPDRFGCIEDARLFCNGFFDWYNWDHHHSGICLMTPGTVHYGLVEEVTGKRQEALDKAFLEHPERFVRRAPVAPSLPEAVWINPPEKCLVPGGGA